MSNCWYLWVGLFFSIQTTQLQKNEKKEKKIFERRYRKSYFELGSKENLIVEFLKWLINNYLQEQYFLDHFLPIIFVFLSSAAAYSHINEKNFGLLVKLLTNSSYNLNDD